MQAYWKFGLCKNRNCARYFSREGAIEDAKRRFKRKLWRRAVKNKGRLHPEIEKLLAKMPSWKSTQNTGTSYDKVMHIFNVIVAMMPEMGFRSRNSPFSVDDMQIPGTPPATAGLWDAKGNLISGHVTAMIKPCITLPQHRGQGKQKALLMPRGTRGIDWKARPQAKGSVQSTTCKFMPARSKCSPSQTWSPTHTPSKKLGAATMLRVCGLPGPEAKKEESGQQTKGYKHKQINKR